VKYKVNYENLFDVLSIIWNNPVFTITTSNENIIPKNTALHI